MSTKTFAALSREQLATLVPELLLGGHLIDRAGLPHVLLAGGADAMKDVAIDEWMGASPVYTKRMQRALGFEGTDVTTIFKGLQLDIGAPPQFMDFRYTVHDAHHGEFALAHCGALMDVEPMGEDYVRRMCHDIEDPTFDATAIATNPKAVMRPIHRPPRMPTDRHPHCAWTVTIDDANHAPPYPQQARTIGLSRAAVFDGVSAIDPAEPGLSDYSGALFSDVPFGEFSHSALVRVAEEVCLQGHLLSLSFRLAVQQRFGEDVAVDMLRKQFTGVAGVVAGRLAACLPGPGGLDGALAVLAVHPALAPSGYTGVTVERLTDRVRLTIPSASAAVADRGWLSILSTESLDPIAAMLRAIDPQLCIASVEGSDPAVLSIDVVVDPNAQVGSEVEEVLLTRVSTAADFVLAGDRPLLTVLNT